MNNLFICILMLSAIAFGGVHQSLNSAPLSLNNIDNSTVEILGNIG